MTAHTLVTIAITVFSLASIALAYYKHVDLRRFGCLVGLTAQPFWIAHIVMTESWGMLPVAPAYSILYLLAIREHWFRRPGS